METRAEEYDKELIGIKKSIDLKLNLSDRLNKQLAKLIEAAGGKENDPLHLQVSSVLYCLCIGMNENHFKFSHC